MRQPVLVDGDLALFLPAFGAAVVIVRPGRLTGSAKMTFRGRPVCVAGDEASVSVQGCPYMTPQHPIPGTGTLTIAALAGDQLAPRSTAGHARLMVRGSRFTARFTVQSPAMQPPPGPGAPIPDATPEYSGSGSFQTSNTTFTGG
jgi:hypothetical protein